MKENAKNLMSPFERWTHKFGISMAVIELIIMWGFPIVAAKIMGYSIQYGAVLAGVGSLAFIMMTFSIGEVLSFTPILGPGSLYMCFMTGNTSNLKMPSAISSLRAADIDTGTPEGDAVAMVSIAISTFVTTIVIIIGIILITPLTPLLTAPSLTPVFNNVIPAVFGALSGMSLIRYGKLSVTPLLVALVLSLGFQMGTNVTLPVCVAAAILVGRIMYNRERAAQK